MSMKTFDSQTARFLASVATCMPPISGDVMQDWINNPKVLKKALKVLSPTAGQSVYPAFTETKLLKPVAKAIVPARTEPFDEPAFYRTDIGRDIRRMFSDYIEFGSKEMAGPAPERSYVALLIKRDTYCRCIYDELPVVCFSTIEDIVALTAMQPNGESGFLLNNGWGNIFFLEDKNVKNKDGAFFYIVVYWFSGIRGWSIGDPESVRFHGLAAGVQFVCPGNVTL